MNGQEGRKTKRPRLSESRDARSNRPKGYRLPTSLSDDRYHDHAPNCAQSPIDGLSHSTIDDSHSNNVPVRHSNLADVHPLRGYVRPCRGSLCPALLPPFRWHVGTSLWHRRARAVLQQIAKARTPLQLPLLFFQIVDSKVSPLCFDNRNPDPELRRFYQNLAHLRYSTSPVVTTS